MKAMIFALTAALALSASGYAQEAPKPTITKEFSGWRLRCFDREGTTLCLIDETLVNKKTGEKVLSVSLQYVAAKKSALMEIGVPFGIAIENGAVLNTDTYKTETLRYRLCNQQGCYLVLPFDAAAVAKFGKATKAGVEVVFFGAKDNKTTTLSFPMDGFTAAYQAMVDASSGKAPAATPEAPK